MIIPKWTKTIFFYIGEHVAKHKCIAQDNTVDLQIDRFNRISQLRLTTEIILI